MASKFTKYDLQNVTDYIEFESFCDDLMSREGYKDIEPLGGGKDKGRDALHIDKSKDETTIFAYSVREDWDKKLEEDLIKIKKHKHPCDKVVFCTSASPTTTQKDKVKKDVKKDYTWELDIFDLDRISTLVDNHYKDLQDLHPSIFTFSLVLPNQELSTKYLDKKIYAEFLLKTYQEWLERFTSLFANHIEIDTYLISTKSLSESESFPIENVYKISPVSVILGESGAGKTTALWKIIVERSKAILEDETKQIPILINLRGWAKNYRCRDLVQEQFALLNTSINAVEKELHNGNCIILIDGLNELRPSEKIRTEAYQELQRFMTKYSSNSFILCCRTTDYDARMLNLEKIHFQKPEHFEIRRMDQNQIVSYVKKYFDFDESLGEELLLKLNVNDSSLWENKHSIVHLARIPLYLQLIIKEYETSKTLPDNKSQLIRTFVNSVMQREVSRNASQIDSSAKERLLGAFAYTAILDKQTLRVSEYESKLIIQTQTRILKDKGLIASDIVFGIVWREIFSNNFLKSVENYYVEWLHQLIFVYFLGNELIYLWLDENKHKELKGLFSNTQSLSQACAIAVGLLDSANRIDFLEFLLPLNDELVQKTYEGQDIESQQELAKLLVTKILGSNNEENIPLIQLTTTLPFLPVVETLAHNFRGSSEGTQIDIAEAISEMIIKYYKGNIDNEEISRNFSRTNVSNQRYKFILKAINRAIHILRAGVKNKSQHVRFFSAKGLWEHDRGLATKTLGYLFQNGNVEIKSLVKDLMDEWEINPYS